MPTVMCLIDTVNAGPIGRELEPFRGCQRYRANDPVLYALRDGLCRKVSSMKTSNVVASILFFRKLIDAFFKVAKRHKIVEYAAAKSKMLL